MDLGQGESSALEFLEDATFGLRYWGYLLDSLSSALLETIRVGALAAAEFILFLMK